MQENIPIYGGQDTRRMTGYNSTRKTAVLALLAIFLVRINLGRAQASIKDYGSIVIKPHIWPSPTSGREIKDFLLDSGSLFFDTTILHENRFYFIHIIDLDGKNDEYLLPAAVRYGGQPEDNHLDIFEAKFRKIWGLPWAFIDVLDGHVYSTWTGNLEIIKIDRTNRQWMTFGKKTNNYHPLQLEETAIASGQSAKQIWDQKGKERTKYSWVGGLFADRELIGLMYLTFDRKTSNWITYLQLYDPNGVFQNEYQLPDVISINAHIQ